MYRTLKTGFRTDQNTLEHLFYVRKVAGQIWNDCVQLGRYYFRLGKKWISKSELQAELKKIHPLTSCCT